MTIADVKSTTEHKMQKSVEALKIDLAKARTGRAHIGLLDHVQVDYYGLMVPREHGRERYTTDTRTPGVQPWERTWFPKVEKAIRDCDLGLNPAAW